jgi:molybdopterin-guanine dinucleotide biosynthesis protein A
MDIAYCILSGGQSRRFKKDKSQEKINNKRLIDYSIELLSNYTDTIYLSCRFNHSKNRILESDNRCNFVKIYDDKPYLGPLCGIYYVMQKIDSEYYLFLSLDMPFVSTYMIDMLIEAVKKPIDAATFKCGQKTVPLPLIVSSKAMDFFKSKECNDKSLKYFLSCINSKTVTCRDCDNLFNINTQDDFKKALKIAARL